MLNITNLICCLIMLPYSMDICYNFVEIFSKQVQTFSLISIFNLMCESSMILKNQKMNYKFIL